MLKRVKNDICFGDAIKQNSFFKKNVTQKYIHVPNV